MHVSVIDNNNSIDAVVVLSSWHTNSTADFGRFATVRDANRLRCGGFLATTFATPRHRFCPIKERIGAAKESPPKFFRSRIGIDIGIDIDVVIHNE